MKASAATSNELLSTQSKKRQKTPLPLCGRSRSIAFTPLALEPGSSPSSYNMMAAAASFLSSSLSTEPAGVALSLWS